ncbi:MAG TPA: hypothetical protein VEX68_22890 [Bryobacteraceae bacterium]|nr:hypothetical protein [Bryobacteraceae bacterium]
MIFDAIEAGAQGNRLQKTDMDDLMAIIGNRPAGVWRYPTQE